MPCWSSWNPGASPTNIRSASGSPLPTTTWVRPLRQRAPRARRSTPSEAAAAPLLALLHPWSRFCHGIRTDVCQSGAGRRSMAAAAAAAAAAASAADGRALGARGRKRGQQPSDRGAAAVRAAHGRVAAGRARAPRSSQSTRRRGIRRSARPEHSERSPSFFAWYRRPRELEPMHTTTVVIGAGRVGHTVAARLERRAAARPRTAARPVDDCRAAADRRPPTPRSSRVCRALAPRLTAERVGGPLLGRDLGARARRRAGAGRLRAPAADGVARARAPTSWRVPTRRSPATRRSASGWPASWA